jgi:tRNA(adenine34) deaminase
MDDAELMGLALDAGRAAEKLGEVPVGAVLAVEGKPIAVAHNEREASHDPTAHAEILALRRGAEALGRWRLFDATLYVTLEPCPMCAGALVHARVARLVYGTRDPRAGAVRTLYQIADDPRLNHRVEIVEGVRAEEAGELLRAFFRDRRREPKS